VVRAEPNSIRLASNVRVVATPHGVIVSSAKGCFRIRRQPSLSFVEDVLPALWASARGSPDWLPDVAQQLEPLGIVEFSSPNLVASTTLRQECTIAVARPTPLLDKVTDELVRMGIKPAGQSTDNVLVLVDHSGLNTSQSLVVLRGVHDRGCPSFSIWRRGTETFYGPLVVPGRSACWNCCRQRFADSMYDNEFGGVVEESLAVVGVVAHNVLLAARYHEIAAFGCVLVDNGKKHLVHWVVPMPWCDLCGGAAEGGAVDCAPFSSSPSVPDEVHILADPRGGILRQLLIFESEPSETPVVPLSCSAIIGPYRDDLRTVSGFNGEGKGRTRESAVWSAIGEGIERYAASLWHPAAIIRAPFTSIAQQAFDPRWLVLYDEEQYGLPAFSFAPFNPERPIDWTTGHWLDTGETALVPALATYLHFPAPHDERFGQTTSNGLAAGQTFDDAALRALYELIERDAFMLYWLARRGARRIADEGFDIAVQEALREVQRFGASTELYLLDAGTQHPTVVCLGIGDGVGWPGVTVGLGSHADPNVAMERAVLEHGHCGTYVRRLMREDRHQTICSAPDVLTGLDHALYYVWPDHVTALDAFRSSLEPPVLMSELRSSYRQEATLETCVARLRDAGIRAAAVDVTSPDVALTPVRVVRAFGSYMQPIHFGFSNRRLNNPRLRRWLSDSAQAEGRPHPIA
jgi:ribosomal protein S12 methylthiotransferase accessory factor